MKKLLLLTLMLISTSLHAEKLVRTVKLTAMNTTFISGEITGLEFHMAATSIIGLRTILKPEETLYVVISSPGGSYGAALSYRRFLNSLQNTEVICKYCASAAGYILATFPKPKRLAIKKSLVIIHEMYEDHTTANVVRNSTYLQSLVKNSDEFNKTMYTIMKVSKQDYEDNIIDKEWVITGADLVTAKLADEYVNLECDNYIAAIAPDTCSN